MSGRIRLIGYVCVLRGSNIYGKRTESANRSEHVSGMHSIPLCATQHYAHYACCMLVGQYTSVCSHRAWPSKDGSAMPTKSQKAGVDPQSGNAGWHSLTVAGYTLLLGPLNASISSRKLFNGLLDFVRLVFRYTTVARVVSDGNIV